MSSKCFLDIFCVSVRVFVALSLAFIIPSTLPRASFANTTSKIVAEGENPTVEKDDQPKISELSEPPAGDALEGSHIFLLQDGADLADALKLFKSIKENARKKGLKLDSMAAVPEAIIELPGITDDQIREFLELDSDATLSPSPSTEVIIETFDQYAADHSIPLEIAAPVREGLIRRSSKRVYGVLQYVVNENFAEAIARFVLVGGATAAALAAPFVQWDTLASTLNAAVSAGMSGEGATAMATLTKGILTESALANGVLAAVGTVGLAMGGISYMIQTNGKYYLWWLNRKVNFKKVIQYTAQKSTVLHRLWGDEKTQNLINPAGKYIGTEHVVLAIYFTVAGLVGLPLFDEGSVYSTGNAFIDVSAVTLQAHIDIGIMATATYLGQGVGDSTISSIRAREIERVLKPHKAALFATMPEGSFDPDNLGEISVDKIPQGVLDSETNKQLKKIERSSSYRMLGISTLSNFAAAVGLVPGFAPVGYSILGAMGLLLFPASIAAQASIRESEKSKGLARLALDSFAPTYKSLFSKAVSSCSRALQKVRM